MLWLQGFADQAMHIADSIVDYARTKGHLLSLLYARISGAAIALCAGDLATAERDVRLAFDLAGKHRLETWNAWAQCFGGGGGHQARGQSRGLTIAARSARGTARARFSPPLESTSR